MASLKERLLKKAAVESKEVENEIEVTEAHKVEVTPKKSVKITPKKVVEPEVEADDEEVEIEVRPKPAKKEAKVEEPKQEKAPKKPAKEKEPKKPAKEKEPKVAVKKLKYTDTWSLDGELDNIDAAVEANDSHLMLAKAINYYNNDASDLQALILASYANNGGIVPISEMKKAYAEFSGKRAEELNAKKLLSLFEKGGYDAESILKLIPESEDEAYTLLLFVENGWNNMGGLSLKGKARDALNAYIKNFKEEVEA